MKFFRYQCATLYFMKTKFLLVSLLSLFSFGTAFAYGDCRDTINGCTIEQLVTLGGSAPTTKEDRISAYKSAIEKINIKIKELTETKSIATSTMNESCLDLDTNLVLGKSDKETNGEVSRLQRFLGAYKSNKMYKLYPDNQIGASAEDFQPVSGYYGAKTAANVVEWQKDHGMDFVTPASGVGAMTRGKMKCGAVTKGQAIQRINWNIALANPTITDENDFQKYAQAISIDVTFADNITKRYKLGNAYGCTGSTVQSTENGKSVFGKVSCYYALTGVGFTAYSQNGKFIVERGDESAKDGSVKKTILLEL